jgi:hypothetical protein
MYTIYTANVYFYQTVQKNMMMSSKTREIPFNMEFTIVFGPLFSIRYSANFSLLLSGLGSGTLSSVTLIR